MSRPIQFLVAAIPLLLTPLLIYGLAEGVLDFGGGEKDILLALPWLIWSLAFAVSSFILICKRWTLSRWLLRSALLATTVLLGLGIFAYFGSFLGIGW
jgi:hypothetical protein